MRPIEFRCWDISAKKWLSDDACYKQVENQARWNPEVCGYFPIMQYTGLKDKNGVKIFEGDIVKEGVEGELIWEGEAKIIQCPIGEVYYAETPTFNIKLLRKGIYQYVKSGETFENLHMNHYDGIYIDDYRKLEIIGNIYEHPHLLTTT